MISTITRRLRDPDSSVRSACVEATFSMSSQITDPPFSTLSKPLIDLLTIDQDLNAQIGAALCLAAAIEAAPEPEVEQLRKVLPRLGKLVKGEGFKAKPALLSVISSIVGVGGASSKGILEWLVPCLVEFLCSEDWAARKAAAEALGKVASMEKNLAIEHKAICLTSLETRRFDKVKVVRETMNRTMELWKEVPGISQEISVPSQSTCSSTDNNIGVCISTASKNSKDLPKNKAPQGAMTTIQRQECYISWAMTETLVGKLKLLHHKEKLVVMIQSMVLKFWDQGRMRDGTNSMPETKCVLFSSIRDDKWNKFGGLKSGSRVVPFQEDESCYSKDVEVSSSTEDSYEDLSLIREQLIQIENQQSSLSGPSPGIHWEVPVSSGRIPKTYYAESTCCNLPGAQFLSPKFWRAEYRYACNVPVKNGSIETCNPGKPKKPASE
ncbi:hypothetical protein OIU78_004259 [Salix suchowensis]|nr:hypothetical protein OIU78_004259 [Salix suchowensis]